MPITHNFKIQHLSEDDFHALDYRVMGLAFSIHRELGRFWNEGIYQQELAHRCKKAGIQKVIIEAPIKVSYQDFTKFYYVDLLIDDTVVYEIKAVQALSTEHRKQTLNYLFLPGVPHGKLINMRPASVEHQFVSTRITPAQRYDFKIDDLEWQDIDDDSVWLKQLLTNLLNEWGAFLDTNLFYQAIYHFRGGEENVVKEIKVMNGAHFLGMQKVHLINPETAFKISAVTKAETYYEQHLRRFIQLTPLKTIQWINFNHERIVFKTIFR